MRIRMMGVAALCLLGAAYTASAGYSWADYQAGDTSAAKPAAKTRGYSWADFQAGDTSAKKPTAKTRGYSWAD